MIRLDLALHLDLLRVAGLTSRRTYVPQWRCARVVLYDDRGRARGPGSAAPPSGVREGEKRG